MDNQVGQTPEPSAEYPNEPTQQVEYTDQLTSKEPTEDSVRWTASEFISHEKDTVWYATSIAVIVVASGLVYMFTRGDLISVVTIIVIGVLFIMLAHKRPRELPYVLDSSGITIGSKHYSYGAFKSFAVHQEGMVGCVNLMPLKRFMPELSIYYPPDQEEVILDILADYLPHDQRKEAGIDRLAKRLRF